MHRLGADFLARRPFAVISSWDVSGASDTSPLGDPDGFIKILDAHALAIPDRKGNQRIDTFHNLMSCDRISPAQRAGTALAKTRLAEAAEARGRARARGRFTESGRPAVPLRDGYQARFRFRANVAGIAGTNSFPRCRSTGAWNDIGGWDRNFAAGVLDPF